MKLILENYEFNFCTKKPYLDTLFSEECACVCFFFFFFFLNYQFEFLYCLLVIENLLSWILQLIKKPYEIVFIIADPGRAQNMSMLTLFIFSLLLTNLHYYKENKNWKHFKLF